MQRNHVIDPIHPAPKLRRDIVEGNQRSRRPAVLVTSSAAPSVIARLLDTTLKELKPRNRRVRS